MNNIQELASAMSGLCSEQDAWAHFHKGTLVHLHETAARTHSHLRSGRAAGRLLTSSLSVAEPNASLATVALQGLTPIRLRELKVGHTHHGRVLFGTLCVNPFKINGIMTVLEDDQGLAVRVGIYNSMSTPSALRAKYSKGAKVAIKEPYFKQTLDGSVAIRVENPANVVRMAEVPGENQSPSMVVEEEPRQGNGVDKGRKVRLLTVFNRAETHFQMGDFERALEVCNEGLEIDPENLKIIFLKGRALHSLKSYDQACQVLQMAVELSLGQVDIEDALRRSKAACARSQHREYDISEFLLGKQPPPEVEDFVGDVEIKKTRGRRGRGLFATKDIDVGELLLVSNAAFIVNGGVRGLEIDQSHEIKGSLQEDLVDAVSNAANKSQKLRQQLYELDDGSVHVRSSLPAMDSFHTSRRVTAEVLPQPNLQRIRDIVSRNSFGGEFQTFGEERREDEESLGFSGLWMLPSFINHSCLPNATRLNVGSAMFLHAAKPIKKREEITISYFDALLPQPQREGFCGVWGFKCNCKRCSVEKSISTALESLNAQFEALHHDALEETNAVRSAGQDFPAELPKSAEFAQVSKELEQILAKFPRMKDEEKNWVRASYVTAYWAGMQWDKLYSVDEIVKAVVSTVPGDFRALAMVAQQLEGLKHQIGSEGSAVEYCAAQARDICVRVLGTHSEHIIQALISRHAKSTIF
ncbi:hypothetical protein SUGI_0493210 [Cryptomeria japonica]|uniref:methyltransferase FGSG_00040-like n=1 Tax=Cryptomeria japonica TaxID=3369 RepID=UPI002408D33F|nr:methyltransferase FGSG_00040-like [Cryptomeria japonica]GLJ25761.1 hypothetical protein SUGI_0493210 [Cryptomeria japonica]